jgi:hypothetical protein
MAQTTFSDKAQILSELWMDYRLDPDFKDFVEYNDLGLPLAYAIANGIVQSNEIADRFVEETFDLLLSGLGIEDTGFESLLDLLDIEPEK